ncbi:dynamin family protein [Pseudalkalibacillus hwajinpoensis]|uniref:dynamin family protein n=1 Tax=Guptibacillus hwajinpoensis TaxID=208199 RepID=UPI00325B3372
MRHGHQTVSKVDVLVERLALIEKQLQPNEATKIMQLIQKLMSGEQHFLFSGHFSAGKSSLINALFETNLLPSSPIPASANTVRVRSGEPGATVHFVNGKKMVFEAPYDIETVKRYCLDGDEVERVELSSPSKLEKDVILIDTPGIDSTDEAHRLSTESSMYLADVVFYVMDYNHVQSEVNYQFIRELHRQNKKIILIVNQIDKHKESEITFNKFQQTVAESFESWGMTLESFFFISLRDQDHPHNQFHQLKAYIEGLAKKTGKEKVKRIYNAAVELLGDITTVQAENPDVNDAYQSLRNKVAFSSERYQLIEDEFQSEAAKIMKSAILMPYDVREAGRAYLESLQPEFKVGIVFREKKTEQERMQRYEAFASGLQEQVKSQLEWHFKQLLSGLVETAQLKTKVQEITDRDFSVDYSVIEEEANKGNGATGEAVLHYTDNLANRLKIQIKQQAERAKDELIEEVKVDHGKVISGANNEFKETLGDGAASAFLKQVEKGNREFDKLWSIMNGEHDNEATQAAMELKQALLQEKEEVIVVEASQKIPDRAYAHLENKEEASEEVRSKLPDPKRTAFALREAAEELKGLPGFDNTREMLMKRAEKLTNKSYTVALFGAFSAGKSSFANALIGESVLPSSPNPTTATLNRICPVTDRHTHKTATIFYKTEDELLEDLQHSLSYFGENTFSIEDSLRIITNGKLFLRESADTKPHALFLRAVLEGKKELDYLGKEKEVTMDEYSDMVVNEAKACFISSISLYYDCPLTKEGITLVDTPGADSINARHTGVAFQYMKSADAILYVTYYNHAFSKADREFLIQLGRVKDVFEMDKMFFLLNAADLAENGGEIQLVLDHVANQLQQYGIRQPSLYPVSSLAGMLDSKDNLEEGEQRFLSNLPERLKRKGGITVFETRFYQFIRSDLSKMAVESNLSELERVQKLLQQWLVNFEMNTTEKNEKLSSIKRRSEELKDEITAYSFESSIKAVQQEVIELVHYIPQRLFYRFNDFFKEAFNPSVISGREGLMQASHTLLEDIGQDLIQELRAASLRMDRFIKEELKKSEREIQLVIIQRLPEFRSSAENDYEMDTPLFSQSISSWLSLDLIQKQSRSLFKTPKQFFEQEGRSQLHDELKRLFEQPVKDYLNAEQQVLSDSALHFFDQMIADLKAQFTDQVQAHAVSQSRMLTSDVNKKQLEEKRQAFVQIQSELVGE